MGMSSTSPPDPPSTTSTTTSSTPRLFSSRPPPQRDPRPPTPPLPYPHHPHTATTYPSLSKKQLPLHTAQSLPNIAPRVPSNTIHQHLAKSHDLPPGILYPVASSGRGFLPKAIRPPPADQTVTITNPGGFPPRSVVAYPHPVRPFGFAHSDPQGPTVHLMRPTHLQNSFLGSTSGAEPGVVKGVPVSAQPKVAPSPSSLSDCNGYKDTRDNSRDDSFATVRDRKVLLSDGASLYALCRSWLRNGFPEESQSQHMDDVKSLPRPLPMPVGDSHIQVKMEYDKEDEDEVLVEHLSLQDLLQRHVKRAKMVRARLREQRLQRITRYKTRLALLLPPIVEQQFRNETAE